MNVLLVGMNPHNAHSAAPYYLKEYAKTNPTIDKLVNIDIIFFDSLVPPQSNSIDYMLQRILEGHYDIIGFSTYCWNINEVLLLSNNIKKLKPNAIVFLGGPEVSGRTEYYLKNYSSDIDYIIEGEGELPFRDFLLYKLGYIEHIHQVPGLVYYEDNEIKKNPIKFLNDLEQIPSIYRQDSLDVNQIGDCYYSYETKRGCQYSCNYCFHHGGTHQIRYFSLSRVFKELGVILNSSLKYVWIVDPCFNENEERAIEIIRFIKKHNKNNIEFGFELKNETLSENFIKELSQIETIRFIAIGLQTINQKALAAVERTFDMNIFFKNMELIRKYFQGKCRIHLDLIFGLPEDTLEYYKKSIDYCLKIGGVVFTQPLKLLSGATLIQNAEQYGFICSRMPPYEVLGNNTFKYEDMCMAKKINVGLYMYQVHPEISKWFDEVHKSNNLRYSDIFQMIGEYLWDKEMYFFFLNYKEYSMGYIIKTIKKILQDLFGFSDFSLQNQIDLKQKVQIDWGSIANLEFVQ